MDNLDPLDLKLLDRWQRDFPLVPRPYAKLAYILETTEADVLQRYRSLLSDNAMTRIGAVFRPNTVGASTLAALAVPAAELERVAELVNGETGVNHNYEREHRFNLWFVVTGRDRSAIVQTLQRIRTASGCSLIEAPLDQAFHLDLGFSLEGRSRKPRGSSLIQPHERPRLDMVDRRLIAALESGLPLSMRPYLDVGTELMLSEASVIGRIRDMIVQGVISRFGVVVRHRRLGYTANAMAVWDIDDDQVAHIGTTLAAHPAVTLCYSRLRQQPDWPYNLFCMIHSRAREEALSVIDELNADCELAALPQAVLFSRRCFKQRGAIYSARPEAA